jgi:DeoD family purine-nucleoside phosphorylase
MTSLNSREDEKGELMHGSLGSLRVERVNHSESIHMRHSEPIHLRPTTTLAERVLLPGDPGRALALAQFLLSEPLMFNHHRGLWGYTGVAGDGRALTIQSTGMGGPSAAIVLHELISLGVRRAIRVGTCGALDAALGLGDLVVASEAICADGASAALGAGALIHSDERLTSALLRELEHPRKRPQGRSFYEGRIVSTDLFYDPNPARGDEWSKGGAIAVEMEAASLFAVGRATGVQVGCLLVVSDTFDGDGARTHIDDEALLPAVEAMGSAAAAALAA